MLMSEAQSEAGRFLMTPSLEAALCAGLACGGVRAGVMMRVGVMMPAVLLSWHDSTLATLHCNERARGSAGDECAGATSRHGWRVHTGPCSAAAPPER